MAVLAVQNLVHPDSVFARMVDGRADFLSNRIVSGPHPAIRNLKHEKREDKVVMTGGDPSWAGLDLARCQEIVDDIGIEAFLVEHQHERRLADGGIIGDIWNETTHVVEPFEIPAGWYVDRSFDWGSTKPFAVLWFAEADGETEAKLKDASKKLFRKGSLFVIAELYGWNGKPNQGLRMSNGEIARRVLKAEHEQLPFGSRVKPGPADSSIFNVQNGESIAADMERAGVRWTASDKGSGSRVARATKLRSMLKAALQEHPEDAPLYVFSTCFQLRRTLPILPRDPVHPDDADTEAEDHNYDALVYRLTAKRRGMREVEIAGF